MEKFNTSRAITLTKIIESEHADDVILVLQNPGFQHHIDLDAGA